VGSVLAGGTAAKLGAEIADLKATLDVLVTTVGGLTAGGIAKGLTDQGEARRQTREIARRWVSDYRMARRAAGSDAESLRAELETNLESRLLPAAMETRDEGLARIHRSPDWMT
jgi:hypothetical protein